MSVSSESELITQIFNGPVPCSISRAYLDLDLEILDPKHRLPWKINVSHA
jgi:hypothetical protein